MFCLQQGGGKFGNSRNWALDFVNWILYINRLVMKCQAALNQQYLRLPPTIFS